MVDSCSVKLVVDVAAGSGLGNGDQVAARVCDVHAHGRESVGGGDAQTIRGLDVDSEGDGLFVKVCPLCSSSRSRPR